MRIENSCNKLACSLYICFIYLNIQKRGTNDIGYSSTQKFKSKKEQKNVFSRLRNDKLCTAVS